MGRKARHTSRTGDGGAELRHRQRQLKDAEMVQKKAELEFFDDPSENDNDSDELESDGSEFGDEEEVMQLGEDDDDDVEEEEGEEDDDDDDVDEFGEDDEKKQLEKMDSKWGKSKKAFYSADTAEFELENDDAVAKDEESAALELQRKQTAMMDDEDFGFDGEEGDSDDDDDEEEDADTTAVDEEDLLDDQLADISMITDESGRTSVEQVKKDFSKMTKKDKLQIVNQTAPELLGLSAELETTMNELQEVVTPAILKLKDVRKRHGEYNTGMQYLVTRQNLMLNYIANISFYLLLRAEGKSVVDHPVLEHLLAIKKQMSKLESVDDAVNTQLHNLLTEEFPVDDGLDKFICGTPTTTTTKRQATKQPQPTTTVKKHKTTKNGVSDAEKEEAAEFYEQAMREKQAAAKAKKDLYKFEKPGLAESDEDEDGSDAEEGGATKRGASYAIIKNKGLKAHKSKLNRNPRVKKREQYRKAVIRRKGQVRDVRVGEAGRYGGETTGIKSNLSRSRKIRS